ncbi:uncharacterized protein AMSG_00827 [Thecamonas trahens ATCC 50062]|uniref:Uncharacterized protein n=1 Tax=Thecamonas trahens ATCC 50062 TaxID=461836 RepID=A0A0L0DEB6_THETB|nr:hypothetical protein AMSG_00827 [Thecamonas trahens ATCC 50062]KNC50667.1 hypothetical protein AMSG_00827 [Thecamonas trahens ATCC 50062]|eukprot:XP_013762547.1 hypothetical protein AMSG_00827 [Thecamonas trahens ATCC 50062]
MSHVVKADEDDPVVASYDLVLSHELQDALYLLQYPTKPRGEGVAVSSVHEVKVKPEARVLRMEVEMHDKVNTNDKPDHPFHHSQFESKLIPLPTEQCVVTMANGVATLSPLTNVLQMRPYLGHLDASPEDEIAPMETEEAKPKSSRVEVKIARPESQMARDRRQNSYAYMASLIEEEEWLTLLPLAPGCGSPDADADEALLSASQVAPSPALERALTVAEYLNAFCPPATASSGLKTSSARGQMLASAAASASAVVSTSLVSRLRLLEPAARLTEILVRVNVIGHPQLASYFPDVPVDAFPALLGSNVFWIHSRWVVAPDVVETEPRTVRARTYLMAVLAASPTASVRREKLAGRLALESQWATEVLSSIAEVNGQLWTLKEATAAGAGAILPPDLAASAADATAGLLAALPDLTAEMEASASEADPLSGTAPLTEQIKALTDIILAAREAAPDKDPVMVLVDALLDTYGVISLEGASKRLQLLVPNQTLGFGSAGAAHLHDILSMSTRYTCLSASPAKPSTEYVRAHVIGQEPFPAVRSALIALLDADGFDALLSFESAANYWVHARVVDELSYISPSTSARILKSGLGTADEALSSRRVHS